MRPRNYSSREFIEEWRDQEPDLCGDEVDGGDCEPVDFSDSILLSEGMTQEDEESYMKVYRKRLAWEEQEAANIREYIDDLHAPGRSGE